MVRARIKNKNRSQKGRYPSTGRKPGVTEGGLYRPEYCQVVVDHGKQGWSEAEIAINCFNVTRRTMRAWGQRYPEFGEALARAREASLSWWESTGRLNLKSMGFNTNLYNKIISCRFRNDYSERVVVAGDPDAPVVTQIERRIVRPKERRE